jgi:hypothetical protein
MSTQPDIPHALDPYGTLRALRDANLGTWSKLMIDLVNSDEYSQATSQWLDTYLMMSRPFQRVIKMTMTQVLTGLNMPTLAEVTSLAERMTNMEMRLDDLDAKLDDIKGAIQAISSTNHATPTAHKVKGGH